MAVSQITDIDTNLEVLKMSIIVITIEELLSRVHIWLEFKIKL